MAVDIIEIEWFLTRIKKRNLAVKVYLTFRDKMTSETMSQHKCLWRYVKEHTRRGEVFMVDIQGRKLTEFNMKDVTHIILKMGGYEIHVTKYITVN